MSDEKRRKLELEYAQTGVVSVQLLREWLRCGIVSREQVEVAAHCNHIAALEIFPPDKPVNRLIVKQQLIRFGRGFAKWDRSYRVFAGLLIAVSLLEHFERRFPEISLPREVLSTFVDSLVNVHVDYRDRLIEIENAMRYDHELNELRENDDLAQSACITISRMVRLQTQEYYTGAGVTLCAMMAAYEFHEKERLGPKFRKEYLFDSIALHMIKFALEGWKDFPSLIPSYPNNNG